MTERITLWMEGDPKLCCRRAEIISKEPIFLLKILYLETICRDVGSRYHCFRISSELNDHATTFWPHQFWLLSARVSPEIVTESEAQFMYLRFRVEREVDLATRESAYLCCPVRHYCHD